MSSVRHDWYQTDERVVIDVLVKNANSRNCSVDIQSSHVSVRGDDLQLDLDLYHEIDTIKSSFRITSVKIEIILQKIIGERWLSLTKTSETSSTSVKSIPQQQQSSPPPAEAAQPSKSSAPSKSDKNWDRVVKDAWEKEDIEKVINCNHSNLYGHINHNNCRFDFFFEHQKEEAKQLNSLFEKIYNESNPEVRRAMNKSFTESGNLKFYNMFLLSQNYV